MIVRELQALMFERHRLSISPLTMCRLLHIYGKSVVKVRRNVTVCVKILRVILEALICADVL
jgi:hypothetical protein